MPELHPQEWLLIVQALVDHAGPEIDSPREQYCWGLADRIAAEQGLSLSEAVRQTDPEWFEGLTQTLEDHTDA